MSVFRFGLVGPKFKPKKFLKIYKINLNERENG